MKLKSYLMIAGILSLPACGSDPKNEGLDDDEARDQFYSDSKDGNGASNIWNDVLAYIGIEENSAGIGEDGQYDGSTEEEITAQVAAWLSTVPEAYTSTDHSNYGELVTNAASKLVPSAISSQCGGIVGISEANAGFKFASDGSTEAVNSNYYYVQYKLTDGTTGEAEESVRTAVLSIPSAAGPSYPLVMYAHGNTTGLQYGEIATLFSDLQANVIIAAPTYPGEPMCTTPSETCTGDEVLADAIHAQSGADIWDGDVNEFLGLYNCVNVLRASTEVAVLNGSLESTDATTSTAALLASVKSLTAGTAEGVPYTLLVGADRGGLVTELAAARAGFYLSQLDSVTEYAAAIGYSGTPATVFPVGLATIGTHVSLTMGTNRLGLQYMFGGIIDETEFSQLPGFSLLGGLFGEYSMDEDLTIADAAAELAIRDLPFMGQFLAASVRNWASVNEFTGEDAKGQIINLHGTEDVVVGYSQAVIADGVFTSINAGISAYNEAQEEIADKVPGFDFATYAFQPADTYYDCYNEDPELDTCDTATDPTFSGDYNHVSDASFLTGLAVSYTSAQLEVLNEEATPNTEVSSVYGCVNATFQALGLSAEVAGQIAGAALGSALPLLQKAEDDTVYSGAYSQEKAANMTPETVAGGWIYNHFSQVNGAVANGCKGVEGS